MTTYQDFVKVRNLGFSTMPSRLQKSGASTAHGLDETCQKTGLGTQGVSAGVTRRYRKERRERGVPGGRWGAWEWWRCSQISQGGGPGRQGNSWGPGGGRELTLVQRRRHAALHPRRVVVHDVDGDVGVPMGDHLHGTVVLSPLREDGVRRGWGKGASEAPACFLLRASVTLREQKGNHGDLWPRAYPR